MTKPGGFVAGLGSVAVDLIASVDELPKEDGFSMVTALQELDGGSCANVLTQITRLGVPAAMVAQVGDDGVGTRVMRGLTEYGIDTSWMLVRKGGISLSTHVYVDPHGAKTIVLYLGDSLMSLDYAQLDVGFLDRCRVFYTDLLPPGPAVEAAKTARRLGKPVVFNMQVELPLMEAFGADRDAISEMLVYTDVFAPCRRGAYALAGCDDPTSCLQALRSKLDYHGLVVLTLGSDGSLIDEEGRITRIPAFPVDAVDTTGAGDSYVGAFIYAYYYAGYNSAESGRFASAAAALTCIRIGARSTPTLDEVKSFLKGR